MSDLISRQAAIDFIDAGRFANPNEPRWSDNEVVNFLKSRPSAGPERKKGTWILVRGSNGKDYHKCSECLHTQDITGVKNYCAVCGAKMIGVKEDEEADIS